MKEKRFLPRLFFAAWIFFLHATILYPDRLAKYPKEPFQEASDLLPLSVSIEFQGKQDNPNGFLFLVSIKNNSNTPVWMWRRDNSWGDAQFSFEISEMNGGWVQNYTHYPHPYFSNTPRQFRIGPKEKVVKKCLIVVSPSSPARLPCETSKGVWAFEPEFLAPELPGKLANISEESYNRILSAEAFTAIFRIRNEDPGPGVGKIINLEATEKNLRAISNINPSGSFNPSEIDTSASPARYNFSLISLSDQPRAWTGNIRSNSVLFRNPIKE